MPMPPMDRDAVAPLRAAITRNHLWATPAETAEWLKTETGQRIAVLIEAYRKDF